MKSARLRKLFAVFFVCTAAVLLLCTGALAEAGQYGVHVSGGVVNSPDLQSLSANTYGVFVDGGSKANLGVSGDINVTANAPGTVAGIYVTGKSVVSMDISGTMNVSGEVSSNGEYQKSPTGIRADGSSVDVKNLRQINVTGKGAAEGIYADGSNIVFETPTNISVDVTGFGRNYDRPIGIYLTGTASTISGIGDLNVTYHGTGNKLHGIYGQTAETSTVGISGDVNLYAEKAWIYGIGNDDNNKKLKVAIDGTLNATLGENSEGSTLFAVVAQSHDVLDVTVGGGITAKKLGGTKGSEAAILFAGESSDVKLNAASANLSTVGDAYLMIAERASSVDAKINGTATVSTSGGNAYGVTAGSGALVNLTGISNLDVNGDTGSAYGVYARGDNAVVNISGSDSSKAKINAGIGAYVRGTGAEVNFTNISLNADTAANIWSGSTLNLTSSDIYGNISNKGNVVFKDGSSFLTGVTVSGTGQTSVAQAATLDVNNTTIKQNVVNAGTLHVNSSGNSIEGTLTNTGTIDMSDSKHTVGTTLKVDTFTGNGENSKINFDADITGSKEATDSIVVTTKADGTVALGSVNIETNDELDIGTSKTLKLFRNGSGTADFSKLDITGTATAASSGYVYQFKQDTSSAATRGNIIATKKYGYTLPQIIQNVDGSGVVSTYSLISDYTETKDLGTLTRVSSGTPRNFTINGNDHKFTSNGTAGITVNNGDTLNLKDLASFNGFNGNAVTNSGTLNITDVLSMDAVANSGNANFSGTNSFAGTVSNSGTLNAYGANVFAEDVTNDNIFNTDGVNAFAGAFTNSGTASLGGTNTFAESVTNNGTMTSTGNSAFAQSLVSTGSLNINGGTTGIGKTLNVSGGTATINNGGSLVVAEQSSKSVNFNTAADSFIINDGGSFMADAFNGNGIITINGTGTDASFDVPAEISNAVSADTNGAIALRLAATGSTKDYTITQYNAVKRALYGNSTTPDPKDPTKMLPNNGLLSFVNGNLVLEDDEMIVIKTKQEDGNTVAIRTDNGFDVVDSTDNKTLGSVDGGYNKRVMVVQNDTGRAPELQQTDNIDFKKNETTEKSITFTAKQLQIEKIKTAENESVRITVKDNSTLRLAGGDEINHSLIVDKDEAPVLTDLVVESGKAEVAGYDQAKIQQGTLNSVTMKRGEHSLGVATNLLSGAESPKTNYIYKNLNIATDSGQKTQVNILNASLAVDKMTMNKGANNTLYLDPSYMGVASVTDNKLSGNIFVGEGSVLNLGNMSDLKSTAALAGMTTNDELSGFTVSPLQTLLALNDNYTLTDNAKLIVDATVQSDGTDVRNTEDADVYFGDGSLLVVNGTTASAGSALSLARQKVAVADSAKLYLTNVKPQSTYTIFSGAGLTVPEYIKGWQTYDTNLFMSRLISYVIINDGEKFVITTKGYDPTLFEDTIPYNSIKAMAERDLLDANSPYGGIQFLSRATDNNYLSTSKMKPTLNEVSILSTTAAVQHAALRATDAMTDAVAEHMSTTLRAASSDIHEGDTTDVWATPFYRSMNWSARNDTEGYIAGFSFGIDKYAGANTRYGLAMHYGTGTTEGDGTVTDTTNSSKAIGVSLYGSKQIGKYNVIGSLGYTDYDNTLSAYLQSTMQMSKFSASPNASTFTADTRVERTFKSGTIDITPHAGVRYTHLSTDSYKTDSGNMRVAETQGDAQDIVQFPIGLALAAERTAKDGWKLKGLLDLSVVPVAGNRDSHTSVFFTGIDNVWNEADTSILDSCSFRGSLAFTAERNYFSSNLGYALQKSSNETNHTFRLWLNWKLK